MKDSDGCFTVVNNYGSITYTVQRWMSFRK